MTTSHPILMSGPMVRAILDGRKTQTRQFVKSIYFRPGYDLWVREAHSIHDTHGQHRNDGMRWGPWGNLPTKVSQDGTRIAYYREGFDRSSPPRWRPSIHMPRWACRLVLNITSVRVERLQEISEGDAIAEGLKGISKDGKLVKYGIPDADGFPGTDNSGWPWSKWETDPRKAYQYLWESLNGPGSWDRNPWVWVIEFEKEDRAWAAE